MRPNTTSSTLYAWAACYRTLTYERPAAEGPINERPSEHLLADDPGYAAIERRAAIVALLTRVPERERAVLHLRFVEDLTQSQIAERLGVSQMQISRLLRHSLAIMRCHAGELLDA